MPMTTTHPHRDNNTEVDGSRQGRFLTCLGSLWTSHESSSLRVKMMGGAVGLPEGGRQKDPEDVAPSMIVVVCWCWWWSSRPCTG
jgi:hypothetical protein